MVREYALQQINKQDDVSYFKLEISVKMIYYISVHMNIYLIFLDEKKMQTYVLIFGSISLSLYTVCTKSLHILFLFKIKIKLMFKSKIPMEKLL